MNMTRTSFKDFVLLKAQETDGILATIPECLLSFAAVSYAKSIIHFVETKIVTQTLPMTAKRTGMDFSIVFGESKKLLEDPEYLDDFVKKSWEQCEVREILPFTYSS